jgi:hypothetical protein
MNAQNKHTIHRFLDEAGDTTFFNKGKLKTVSIGNTGVSNCFILGMVKFNTDLNQLRTQVIDLQKRVESDSYFNSIRSINKKKAKGAFYFHATDDIPEVRKILFEFIKGIDCSFEAVVGRKILSLYEKKHNQKGNEFYADLLSHLLKNKFFAQDKLVLNVAQRQNSTENQNLQLALNRALSGFVKDNPKKPVTKQVVFNVQNHKTEPLLNIADYFCWAVQRVFEKGEDRYYDFLKEKIELVVDVYDANKSVGNRNYYTIKNPLTEKNKLSPPSF